MKVVRIIWKDARTFSFENFTLEQVKKVKLADTHTIGYLVYGDKEKLIVCSFFHPVQDEDEVQNGYRDVHVIPKSCVVKVEELKNAKKK